MKVAAVIVQRNQALWQSLFEIAKDFWIVSGGSQKPLIL
jgi:hypothetical protein